MGSEYNGEGSFNFNKYVFQFRGMECEFET